MISSRVGFAAGLLISIARGSFVEIRNELKRDGVYHCVTAVGGRDTVFADDHEFTGARITMERCNGGDDQLWMNDHGAFWSFTNGMRIDTWTDGKTNTIGNNVEPYPRMADWNEEIVDSAWIYNMERKQIMWKPDHKFVIQYPLPDDEVQARDGSDLTVADGRTAHPKNQFRLIERDSPRRRGLIENAGGLGCITANTQGVELGECLGTPNQLWDFDTHSGTIALSSLAIDSRDDHLGQTLLLKMPEKYGPVTLTPSVAVNPEESTSFDWMPFTQQIYVWYDFMRVFDVKVGNGTKILVAAKSGENAPKDGQWAPSQRWKLVPIFD